MSNETKTGRVKFYNEVSGYGFITKEEDGSDVFVHATSLLNKAAGIKKDDLVEFDIADGKRGTMAVNVSKKN